MIKLLILAALLFVAYRFAVRALASPKATPGARAMPRSEAARVLGVADDADRDAVIEAHRRLIGRNHPDAGGTADLAARINQARDTLLS